MRLKGWGETGVRDEKDSLGGRLVFIKFVPPNLSIQPQLHIDLSLSGVGFGRTCLTVYLALKVPGGLLREA